MPDESAIASVIDEDADAPAKLSSFGCAVTVKLSSFTSADSPATCMMVEMKDECRMATLRKAVQTWLWGEEKALEGKSLQFSWINHLGDPKPLDSTGDIYEWFDTMWCHHPLQLHVYADKPVKLAIRSATTS